MGVLCFTLFLFGIMLLIVYFAVMHKHKRCTTETQGTLLRILHYPRSRTGYIYTYTVDGIEYRFKTFDRSPQTNAPGDRCVVWYNPKKPKLALARRYRSYKPFKVLLFGGIASIALSLILPFVGLALQTWG